MDEARTCDLVTTFDAIHDQANPQMVLDAIHRTLRPGGFYLMQDIRGSSMLEKNMDHVAAPFLYSISTMHCMTVSLALGGDGLGTMWGGGEGAGDDGKGRFRPDRNDSFRSRHDEHVLRVAEGVSRES